jgi:hypothetical protein
MVTGRLFLKNSQALAIAARLNRYLSLFGLIISGGAKH